MVTFSCLTVYIPSVCSLSGSSSSHTQVQYAWSEGRHVSMQAWVGKEGQSSLGRVGVRQEYPAMFHIEGMTRFAALVDTPIYVSE